jgi:hypothetical protein
MNDLPKVWDELEAELDAFILRVVLPSLFDQVRSEVAELNLESGISELPGRLAQLEGDLDSLPVQLGKLAAKTEIARLEGELDAIRTQVDGFAVQIKQRPSMSELTALVTRVVALEEKTTAAAAASASTAQTTPLAKAQPGYNDVQRTLELEQLLPTESIQPPKAKPSFRDQFHALSEKPIPLSAAVWATIAAVAVTVFLTLFGARMLWSRSNAGASQPAVAHPKATLIETDGRGGDGGEQRSVNVFAVSGTADAGLNNLLESGFSWPPCQGIQTCSFETAWKGAIRAKQDALTDAAKKAIVSSCLGSDAEREPTATATAAGISVPGWSTVVHCTLQHNPPQKLQDRAEVARWLLSQVPNRR